MNKEEIEKEGRGIKISMPLLTKEEMIKIDNNFNEIVKEFTKQFIEKKDLAIAQYIIDRQQKELKQKSETLDKVKEECYRLKKCEDRITRELDEFYQGQECLADKILNIIEGEKNENTKDFKEKQ